MSSENVFLQEILLVSYKMHDSYVGIIYLIFIKASSPPFVSNICKLSLIKTPMSRFLRWAKQKKDKQKKEKVSAHRHWSRSTIVQDHAWQCQRQQRQQRRPPPPPQQQQQTPAPTTALTIINLIPGIGCLCDKDVHDGQQLSVIRDERFTDQITTRHQMFQTFQRFTNDVFVPGVQRGLDGND